jgi:nucleosome binding factor SPN SPT16 subunit
VLSKAKRPQLKNLTVRPNLGDKKTTGVLECQLNGFRFTSPKSESIDIIFSNIRHAFFQPCAQEIIAAVHFNLKNPLLINKKKIEDIQFYMEGGLTSEDIEGKKKGAFEDEEEEEDRERAKRKKIDREIEAFLKSCEEESSGAVSFEMPARGKGFFGNPFRSTSLLQPTKSCLVSLVDQPFFVMEMDRIEVAVF